MREPREKRLFHLDRFGRRLRESVDEELSFHLETRLQELMREGKTREEAFAEVLRTFGDPELVSQRCRRIDTMGARRRILFELCSDALSDVRFAFRALMKARGYTAVVVLSLAVGIGVNSALFTAIHAVWMAPVPGVAGQDRIVDPVTVDGGHESFWWTYPDFAAVVEAETPFEALTAWIEGEVTIGSEDGPGRVRGAWASGSYFRVLGVQPVRGRGFLPSEDQNPGEHPVVLLGHDLWQERFAGREDILGQSILVNRTPYTIVGVAPEGFKGARITVSNIDLWLPLTQHPGFGSDESFVRDRERFSVQVLGRLREGSTRAEAQASLQTVFARLESDHPETNENRTVRAAAFGRFPAQNRIWDLIALVGVWGLLAILLLIICGNLAGMALARSAAREQEIGVRLALGSSRLRLVRHLMVEAVVLAMAGGAVGTLLAITGMATLSPMDLGVAAPGVTFQPGGWVLAMSFALALASAMIFGLFPALRFSRGELVSALKDDSGGGGRRTGRLHRIAASAQVGAALSLLVVGALFLRSLGRTTEAELGFQPRGLMVTDFGVGGFSSSLLDLSEEGYPSLQEGGGALLDRIKESLGSVPGVAAVAVADGLPLDRVGNFGRAAAVERPDEPEGRVTAEFTSVTEGYLTTIGTPILVGRDFRPDDDASSEPVAVITRTLADRLWPGEEALGRQFLWPAGSEDATPRTVVGLVGEVASSRPAEDWPHVFIPARQSYPSRFMIVIRATGDPSALAGPLREAFRTVDPGLPVPRLVSGQALVARATQDQRAAGRMGGGLGLVVLLLSAIGVYGVVALAVTHRTREIGLRMALGATRGTVLLRVLADALRLCTPGMAVGALLAAGTAAAMRSMLLGLSPLDPISFLLAGGLLFTVVFLAALPPALRASGIQPVQALRMK